MKIKTILIILIGLLVISLLINLQVYMAKKAIEIEIGALRNENKLLFTKIDEAVRNNRQLQDKFKALSNDLARVSQERENLKKEKADTQKLYEAAVKERDALIEKIKVQEAAKEEQKKSFSLNNRDSYWADILKVKMELEAQLEKAYSQLQIAQSQNKQLRQEKKNLELELASQKDIVDSMALELVQKSKDRFQLEEALKPLKDKNEILKLQLRALNKERNKSENRLQDLRVEKTTMEDKLTGTDKLLKDKAFQIDDLQKQLETSRGQLETTRKELEAARIRTQANSAPPAAMKESVELPPIVVRLQPGASSAASPDKQMPLQGEKGKEVQSVGEILGINRENNFVMINLGRSAGMEVGNILQVYRGASAIATLEVIQVRESICACNIKEEISSLKVGDTVR